ncbi:type III-B CRISPR module RAMP protein Cmr6 [Hydrogenophilus thermoluteolus]|uniref:type III-B CRISPR module RAMP protein Cmr6 n=1 Tax=Hydrogenophilus thermoluteolus TaxID=297 RepID=UPI003F66E78F
MPIAAVPKYLRETSEQFYLEAPPGHRFTLYFPVWGLDAKRGATPTWKREEVALQRKKGHKGKPDTWEDKKVDNKLWACTVSAGKKPDEGPDLKRHIEPKNDEGQKKWKELFESLSKSQNKLAEQAASSIYTISALATAPFTTGLGNEHPLENGFAFLWPYGLPYLPGSGVKGVVRRAAQELAEGLWGDTHGWSLEPGYEIEVKSGKERTRIQLSVLDVLFGREPPSGDSNAVRGALSFWDVIPLIAGDSLMVEVMTPHQSHYYQQNTDPKTGNSTTPHDSGQPKPIFFLTVPPGSEFKFYVVCDTAHLKRLTAHKLDGAPDLLATSDGRPLWQQLLQTAFEHAFEWLGFGAKTALGYGAMTKNQTKQSKFGNRPHSNTNPTPKR